MGPKRVYRNGGIFLLWDSFKACWIGQFYTTYVPHLSLIRDLSASAPLPSSMGALHAFVFSCAVLLQLKGKGWDTICVCDPLNHSPSVSLISFNLPYQAVLHVFSYVLSSCLYHDLYNSLREKCPYSELFWPTFFCIRTE